METAGKPGGFFVSFEGPEGGGKSTQTHRLAAALAEQGYVVWTTREPGGTRVGEMIRPILLGPQQQTNLSAWAEALLFTAARAQLVDEVIRPRLLRGQVVLCDRFSDSTLAYQGFGRGLELEALQRLQAQATGGLKPDLTLLLDLAVEAGLARIPRLAKDRLDRETIAFHQRVHAGYRAMAAQDPPRWRTVDASQDPDQVASRVLEHAVAALQRAGIRPAERRLA
jgi:dTMP kinase